MENRNHLQEFQTQARIVGQAPAFLRAIEKLPAIAQSSASVLIGGESGTGKELIARAIHYLSDRAPYAFVAVNCGSFPDSLLESELFGHERGAFTTAYARRDGLIAQADGGTLFLDEVDSLSPKAQVDLLRVLQDKKFRLVGSSTERQSNVRFVAATNAAMEPLLRSGAFRSDLFYRLCVFSIPLPALRERREDIMALAEHLVEKHRPANGRPCSFSPAAREVMMACDWPGNVRELENAVIRGIYLSTGNVIEVEDLGLAAPASQVEGHEGPLLFKDAKRAAVASFEREYLGRLLSQFRGNITNAARAAGKDRRDLGRLLKKHRLDPKAYLLRQEIA
jgi:DNA-binding NtrC family response regulator